MIEPSAIHELIAIGVILGSALFGLAVVAVAIGVIRSRHPIVGWLHEVAAPEGGGTPEQLFVALHGLLRPWHRRLLHGQPWIGFELWGSRGQVRFGIWIPQGQEPFVEHLLRASYPGVELRPTVSDPLLAPTEGVAALANVGLARTSSLPIRIDVEGDCLASLLSTLARARGDERIHLSLLARPRSSGWQGAARDRARRLRAGRPTAAVFGTQRHGRQAERRPPTPWELEQARLIEEKARHLGFDCCLRVVAVAEDRAQARGLIRDVVASFRTFEGANGFRFRPVLKRRSFLSAVQDRRFPAAGAFLLTAPELAALWHFPVEAPPHVEAIRSPKLPPPPMVSSAGRVIGVSTYPGQEQAVGILAEDSRRHLHVLGPTGTGKSTLLLNLALQDLEAGRGVGIIDPKGDLVEAILARFPRERLHEVVLISPEEADVSIGINPLEWSDPDERDLIAENALSIFRRIYERYWGPRTDDILKSALLTLLTSPDTTICHIPVLLTDKEFRRRTLKRIEDPIGLASFWRWYEGLTEAQRADYTSPLSNKLRDFLLRPRVRRLLCQPRSTVDLQSLIDSGGVLLANLSTGRWGDQTAALLGSFLVAKIWQAVRHRAHVPEEARRDFMLYVDEFQQFLGIAGPFADTLAMARSFRLSLTLANQHLGQLPRDLREALSSNARSRIVFQCGQDDSRYLAREFAPLDSLALQALPRYEMAVRLSIQGETSRPFTARALAPPPVTDPGIAGEVSRASRQTFGRPARAIDEELRRLLVPDAPPPAGPEPSPFGPGRVSRDA
jgi:hypothetical protein